MEWSSPLHLLLTHPFLHEFFCFYWHCSNTLPRHTGTTPSCVTPPPPPPALSCPASNFQWVTRGTISFQIFCNHAVRTAKRIANTRGFLGILGGPDSYFMASNLDQCITGCAAHPMCNGANFWPAQGYCAMNTLPRQQHFWQEGCEWSFSLFQYPKMNDRWNVARPLCLVFFSVERWIYANLVWYVYSSIRTPTTSGIWTKCNNRHSSCA